MSVAADEEWVKAAMSNDAMVVDLLVRLNHTSSTPPLPRIKRSVAALPLEWSVRQRRSKSGSVNPKKPPLRGSPTTPLYWSGATSVSGGSEESSRPPPFELPNTVNGDGEKTRSRKKKTLTQLKEEESLLVKERRELNREITALHMKLEKQRATNESLKRMKLELQPHLEKATITSQEEGSVSGQPVHCIIGKNSRVQSSSIEQNEDAKFFLPDLNMPFDDTSSDAKSGAGLNLLHSIPEQK